VGLDKDTERRDELQEQVEEQEEKIEEHGESLDEVEDEIERLEGLEDRIEEARDLNRIYSSSEKEMREVNLRRLERKVFNWYQELSASQEFKDLRIDRDTYQLRGTPQNAGQELGITDYQGGGQRTLTALAYQLALAEMTESTDFLMVDEPTDATDSENRENLLEMIHKAEKQFNQILLITHHGAGREKAENIIRVEKEDSETSKIEYPVDQT
jgi:ATPase involved in DNA repair